MLYSEKKKHKIDLYYWDGNANEYKLYKSYELLGGKTLDTLDLEGMKSALVAESGTQYEFGYFADKSGGNTIYVTSSSTCIRDMSIYPIYERTVEIKFSAGEGLFPATPTEPLTSLYTETKLNYKLTATLPCVKESTDKYHYTFIGWRNTSTGEEILLDNQDSFEFTIICDVPTTFEAIFEQTLRCDYSITIRTEHGTLKNGEKEIVLTNVDYDTYISVKNEYEKWTPENVRDEENHCTYVYRGAQILAPTSTSYSSEYIYWDKQVDKHVITININGTDDGVITVQKEWNVEIDLSELIETKEDDVGLWKIISFTDKAGNTYSADGKYTVTADDTLTPNWAVESYKEYKITLELDGKVIDTKIYHKNDTIEAFAKPAEADTKVFSGWTWYGSDGNEIEPLSQMPADDLTLKGTSSYVYIRYVVDGKEISEYTAIGKVGYTETVREIYKKEGYTVQPWSTSNAEVSDGKFTMPECDVIFTTTTAKNSYTLTYYHNSSVYGEIKTVPYGEYVLLEPIPSEEGQYLAWSSDDVTMSNVGFTMPAHDVTITSIASEVKQYIIYYINGEIIGYETAIPGQEVQVRGEPTDAKYSGMTFSGWYCQNTALDDTSTVKVGNDTVYILGYYTSGDVKVNIFFDETNTSPDIILYANAGDSISIDMLMDKADLGGYKVNGELVSEITIPEGSTEINAYVQYTDKTYMVNYYNGHGFVLPADAYYNAGDKVYIDDIPTPDDENWKLYGWFTAEAEILQDGDGKSYFIMPERDVSIILLCEYEYPSENPANPKTASVYINSPYSSDPVFLMDYTIDSDEAPKYFDIPIINGYEFVGWNDENGNIVADENNGIYLSDMNGKDCNFYGEYRKIELHMIEFRLNNVVIGYQKFYDSSQVSITAPTITLADGEVFSGWKNIYVNPYTSGNSLSFNTGETGTHEYAGMDFIFNGYICNEENRYSITVKYPSDDEYGLRYDFETNENATINLSPYESGQEYTYLLHAYYYYADDESYTVYDVCIDAVVKDNGQYIITIPSVASVKEAVGTDSEIELSYFEIVADIYNPDAAY